MMPTLGLDELRHVVAALDDARRYLDGDVVGYFRRRLSAAASQDGARGPRRTLPPVLGVIGAIEHAAREVKPNVRRELLAVGARSAEFAAWLYRDGGTPQIAEYWRDRAIEWAQAANDAPMQGYVLLKKSQAAFDERDGVRMLTLAEAATDGPWRLPAKVRVEALQQQARAHALIGDELALVERRLDEAHALMAECGFPESGSDLSAHYGQPLLNMQTALCYVEAGKPARAVDLYDRHLTAEAFSRRDFGYFMSLKAVALAYCGRPDEAATTGIQAADVAGATGSTRTTAELRRLVGALRPWAERPAVRDLRDVVSA
jgi:hypothetical protein